MLDADGKGTFTLGIMPLDFYGVAITQQDMAVIVLDSTESAELEATAGDLQGAQVQITGQAVPWASRGERQVIVP